MNFILKIIGLILFALLMIYLISQIGQGKELRYVGNYWFFTIVLIIILLEFFIQRIKSQRIKLAITVSLFAILIISLVIRFLIS